jgi:hypothetical protein
MTEWWTIAQAAEHCDGVTESTYRSYVARQGAPAAKRWDRQSGKKVVAADLVRRWHRERKGRGARTDIERERAHQEHLARRRQARRTRENAPHPVTGERG